MPKEVVLQLGLILEIQDAPDEISTQIVVNVHEDGFDTQHVRKTDDGSWEIISPGGGLFDEQILEVVGFVPPHVFLEMYAESTRTSVRDVVRRLGGHLAKTQDKQRRVVLEEK